MLWMIRWAGFFPIFVKEAKGAHFTDVDGNEYIDFCLGDTGAMTGHAPDKTIDAIVNQVKKGITSMLPTEDVIWVGDGVYYVFNLPFGAYGVKAWFAGRNSTDTTVNVLSNTETSNVNLVLTAGAAGGVTGQITFLATTNIEVDVALTHPRTRETIPGLSTQTVNRNYTIGNVPNGTYLARATYVNDGKVVDPDWIIKNGEPFVTVTGGSVSRDFSVTGAVELLNPTNPATSTQPVNADTMPLFSWQGGPH